MLNRPDSVNPDVIQLDIPMAERDYQINACLEIMRDAILQSRVWGWSGDVPAEQLADLMDAIHNFPTFIQHREAFGIDLVRDSLRSYDKKWPRSADGSNGLLNIFDQMVFKQAKMEE